MAGGEHHARQPAVSDVSGDGRATALRHVAVHHGRELVDAGAVLQPPRHVGPELLAGRKGLEGATPRRDAVQPGGREPIPRLCRIAEVGGDGLAGRPFDGAGSSERGEQAGLAAAAGADDEPDLVLLRQGRKVGYFRPAFAIEGVVEGPADVLDDGVFCNYRG
jgi:hypothetical protein